MPRVELIYDADCPNVGAARASLLRAFARARVEPRWMEWERSASESPPYAAMYGSPSILVDGMDVDGATPSRNACCRLYRSDDGGQASAPDPAHIAEFLRRAERPGSPSASRTPPAAAPVRQA